MKMDVIATTRRSVAVVLALAGVLFFVLLAWIGGELHYGNCVAGAEARHPVTYRAGAAVEDTQRVEAIDGCSRWP